MTRIAKLSRRVNMVKERYYASGISSSFIFVGCDTKRGRGTEAFWRGGDERSNVPMIGSQGVIAGF